MQTVRDLLECVWPAALETAKHPFRSATWVAALTVVVAAVTAGTWTGPAGSGWPGSSGPSARR